MKVKFGELAVGAEFKELPDKYGGAFIFTLVKIEPRFVTNSDGTKTLVNAGTGKMLTHFNDDEMVEKV